MIHSEEEMKMNEREKLQNLGGTIQRINTQIMVTSERKRTRIENLINGNSY